MIFKSFQTFANVRQSRNLHPTLKAIILWHIFIICYQLCPFRCNGEPMNQDSKLIDLSYEFNNSTIYWVKTKPLFVNVTHNGTLADKGYWYHMEEISASTHGGTHLDAPCHFVQGRWCVSDIPIEKLVVPAVVVDISSHVQDDPTAHLSEEHLTSWEEKNGKIPDGSLLLIYTGWSKRYPDVLNYTGTLEQDPSKLKFPAIKPEAAEWLVNNRNIVGIGIDSLSVEIPGSPIPRTHQILEDKNIYGIENVNGNLMMLPPVGSIVYVMPMKLKGASGAPCRVFASLSVTRSNASSNKVRVWNSMIVISSLYFLYLFWKNHVHTV